MQNRSTNPILGTILVTMVLVACSPGGGDDNDGSGNTGNTNSGNTTGTVTSLSLNPIGSKQVLAGERLTFTVSVSTTNPDGGTLSYTADGNAGLNANPLMNGASFDEMTRQFDWQTDINSPSEVYSIRFTVTDSSSPPDSDSELISIEIMNKFDFGESKYQQHCQSCHGPNGINGSRAGIVQCMDVQTIRDALGLTPNIGASSGMGSIARSMDNTTRDVDAISYFLRNVASC